MRIPILTYHQITCDPHPAYRKYAITPQEFSSQLKWLADNGFCSVRLHDIFGTTTQHLPVKPVVLTFDDGFQDCIDYAIPILSKYRFTATFFVVAGLVGRTSRWLMAERGLEYPLMDWAAMRELLDHGFEFGSHGLSHQRLAAVSADECLRELRDSRAELEDGLGVAVRHVAYPFGSFSGAVRQAAETCGYVSGCTVVNRIASSNDDPLALPRIHVLIDDGVLAFTRHLQPGTREPVPLRRFLVRD